MATPFSDIYDSFLTKIDDPDLISMQQPDLEDTMFNWLKSSITRFEKCYKNLNNYDETSQQFNENLGLDEIEILSLWMVYFYTNKYIYRENVLAQSLSNKDYALTSQANHLKQLLALKESTYKDIEKHMTDYLYNNFDLDKLG